MAFVPNRKPKALPKRKTRHLDDGKPPWDDSISNLAAHKPSSDELNRRKQETRPSELTRQQLKAKISAGDAKFANSEVLRNILFAHRDIDDILAESDKTMSLVQDLFGENPGKYSGISSVTPAPSYQKSGYLDSEPGNLVSSHFSDDNSDSEYRSISEFGSVRSQFQNGINLDHYKALLKSTEDELRMLNNGVMRASESQRRKPSQNVTTSLQASSSRVDETLENDSQLNNGADMRLILRAIEDLKSALLTKSATEESQPLSTERSQIDSQEEQLSKLRNIYPLIQRQGEKVPNAARAQQPHQTSLQGAVNDVDFDNLKTFDQLIHAVRHLSAEQKTMRGLLKEREEYSRSLELKIERQNATIRALAEDIIQLQGVMAHWAEVHNNP